MIEKIAIYIVFLPLAIRCKALFKPFVEGHCEGWHRVPIEAAAYHLNLLLGMDYVPPAFYRPQVCQTLDPTSNRYPPTSN